MPLKFIVPMSDYFYSIEEVCGRAMQVYVDREALRAALIELRDEENQ